MRIRMRIKHNRENAVEFKPWPKIPRGQGEGITITEKLDGTNACIVIEDNEIVAVQSRNRFITPEDDNYGFAGWVSRNESDLLSLGEGYHYGEWVGLGIQKNPHNFPEKRFYLFNSTRWNPDNPNLPDCCRVVPVLYQGQNTIEAINNELEILWNEHPSPISHPEGIIVWFHKTRRFEKYTFRNQRGKWSQS